MQVTTLQQALADDIHPGELFRAARWNERAGNHKIAAEVRALGYALANALGIRVRHRLAARPNGANDNRNRKHRRAA